VPVTDLSLTTEALQRLLDLNINGRIDPGLTPPSTVSTLPLERVAGGANVLNLYCYHISEDPHTKLRPRQGRGGAIATSPMSLVLHYIVTAHTLSGTVFDALGEQRLLGHAMKTFHDFPVLDDGTLVGTNRVLPLSLQGADNRFEITMVQMTAPESLTFWANEDQVASKPAAYYEVRPVELAPEPPTRVPGIVLTLGAFVVNLDSPTIAATEGEVPYTLPAVLGGAPTVSRVSPAKVGPVPPPARPVTNLLRLKGAALSKGVRQHLDLTNRHWSLLIPELPRLRVDFATNAAAGWTVSIVNAGEVTITFGDDLSVTRPDGTTVVLPLYPGTYVASWEVEEVFDRPDGSVQVVGERSNDAAFTVCPVVTGTARNAGNGAVTLTFGGSWLVNRGYPVSADPIADPPLDLLVSVDGIAYRLRAPPDPPTPQPPLQPGEFEPDGAHTITYMPLAAADTSGLHTIRVVVDGADTQPLWLEIP
jgi:hypothetical protein